MTEWQRGLSLAAALLASSAAFGQIADYPTHPIRMLVGFPAGGSGDQLARTLGERLAESLGQPVIVDNRPGAGGKIAAELLAQAAPDGYTLMLTSAAPIIVAPALGQKLNFDPRTLVPVAKLTDSMVVLLAGPSVGIKSVKEMIALAKARPGTLNYASPGVGTLPHLSGELLKSMAGLSIEHVPYKGTAAILPAQIGGEVALSLVPLGGATTQIRAGRVVALGVTGARRSVSVPEIPTLAESGLTGFDVSLWYGMFAAPKTPEAIVRKLNERVLKVLAIPQVREQLLQAGLEPNGSSPAQLEALVRSEEKLWVKVVKDAKIKAD